MFAGDRREGAKGENQRLGQAKVPGPVGPHRRPVLLLDPQTNSSAPRGRAVFLRKQHHPPDQRDDGISLSGYYIRLKFDQPCNKEIVHARLEFITIDARIYAPARFTCYFYRTRGAAFRVCCFFFHPRRFGKFSFRAVSRGWRRAIKSGCGRYIMTALPRGWLEIHLLEIPLSFGSENSYRN